MSSNNRNRRWAGGVGMAAGAFLAAGLISLATSAVARADDDGAPGTESGMPNPDTDAVVHVLNFGPFQDISVADPDDGEFVANEFTGPFPGPLITIPNPQDPFLPFLGTPNWTDVLTSGADPADNLGCGTACIGVAGELVNTFTVPSDPALDSTFSLPLTDPLAQLFTLLLPLGF